MFTNPPPPTTILGSVISLLILDVIAVILRFYTRRRLRQPLQIDDWLMIPSLILTFGLCSIMFYGIRTKSLGYRAPATPGVQSRSAVDADDWTIVTARRLEYSFLVIFATTNGLIKLSVLFLYRRIFVISKHWTDIRNVFLALMITLIAMWAGAFTFAFMFMCKGHFEVLFFDLEATATECVDTFMVGYSCSISDFVGDALIIMIPIPFIWKLQMSATRKFAITIVFLTGMLAFAASLIRMLWMIWATQAGYDPSLDEELLLTFELFWCLMEITIGLIASCLPTIRGLFRPKSVDSIVKSTRNFLAIHSGSSSRSLGSSNRALKTQISTTSQASSGIN